MSLIPVLHNETRWMSEYAMLIRTMKVQEYLRLSGLFDEVEEIVIQRDNDGSPSVRQAAILFNVAETNNIRDKIQPKISQMNKYSKLLQDQGMHLAYAERIFEVARECPIIDGSEEWKHRLTIDHQLHKYKEYERACIKLEKDKDYEMNDAEREAAKPLLKDHWKHIFPKGNTDIEDDDPLATVSPSKYQEVDKMLSTTDQKCKYLNPKIHQRCTTVALETSFSDASKIMTHDRKRIQPRLLEAIMMLKKNEGEWWDLDLFHKFFQGKYKHKLAEAGLDDHDRVCTEQEEEDDVFEEEEAILHSMNVGREEYEKVMTSINVVYDSDDDTII
jgi:hypothetical protein